MYNAHNASYKTIPNGKYLLKRAGHNLLANRSYTHFYIFKQVGHREIHTLQN